MKWERIVLSIRPAAVGAWFANAIGLNRRRTVKTPDGSFYVNPVSNFGYRVANETYEPNTKAAIVSRLRKGDTFVDLGANEGYFSIIASRIVGSSGRVIAIEPQSRLQEIIQRNCSLNECENVTLFQGIVSSSEKDVELMLAPETNTGSSGMYRQTRYALPSETVSAYKLPSVFRRVGISRCDVMKVDIEGAEYELITNDDGWLGAGIVSCLIIEIHTDLIRRRLGDPDAIRRKLLSSGYRMVSDGDPSIYERNDIKPTKEREAVSTGFEDASSRESAT